MVTLVTGSAGHLGEALVRTLRTRGETVIGLDIKPSSCTDIVGSITDRAVVRRALSDGANVIHAATLHKPHIVTHTSDEFVRINVAGTLTLLEESAAAGVQSFVYTSTTSAFGSALTPPIDAPAAWIVEDVVPVPKNIYGVTKTAAEGLCEMFARRRSLPVIVLRVSRFFPEADDDADVRRDYSLDNAHVNELLYRRVDLADVVGAHIAAVGRAPNLGFGRYIISATTPFEIGDLAELRADTPRVVRRRIPQYEEVYRSLGWTMRPSLDRVYVNQRALTELHWAPRYGFQQALECLAAGVSFRSPLALAVGAKGYHADGFGNEPYPVE